MQRVQSNDGFDCHTLLVKVRVADSYFTIGRIHFEPDFDRFNDSASFGPEKRSKRV